jgi:hypothetical protein
MVQAARDSFIPASAAQNLWRALGRPPIQWIDTNHLALQAAQKSAMKTATSFLRAAWQAQSLPPGASSKHLFDAVPRVRVPTLKAGAISGIDSAVTPSVQLQVLALGTRRHMSLLNANVGLSGRGPFLSLAATVNAYVDVGVARRLGGSTRPYVSWHVVF